MCFSDYFLKSKNQDCLEEVLSFLRVEELGKTASSCRVLHQIIHQESMHAEAIWQAAEKSLTCPSDRQPWASAYRVGSSARDHCRLFATASGFARACEASGTVVNDRMKVNDVLNDLISVRGYSSEELKQKMTIGSKETRPMEEAASDIKVDSVKDVDMEDKSSNTSKKEENCWEKITAEAEPDKDYYHQIFVRISHSSTGELISQGFCGNDQKLHWHAGLDMTGKCQSCNHCFPLTQALQVYLTFESLRKSDEIESFLSNYSAPEDPEEDDTWLEPWGNFDAFTPGLIITAVVIDERDFRNVRCLFQPDRSRRPRLRCISPGFRRGMIKCEFPLGSQWGEDTIQLGPSVYSDRYYLSYSLSYNVATFNVEERPLLLPILEIDIHKDRSLHFLATQKSIKALVMESGDN